MAVVIFRVAVLVDEVIAVYIIYIPISIIIHTHNSIQFHLIDPHIVIKVSMSVINTRIRNSDYNIITSCANIPGLWSIYIAIGRPRRRIILAACRVILTCVVQRPLQRIKRVIRGQIYGNNVIQLGVLYTRMALICRHHLFQKLPFVKLKFKFVYPVKLGNPCIFRSSPESSENTLFLLCQKRFTLSLKRF